MINDHNVKYNKKNEIKNKRFKLTVSHSQKMRFSKANQNGAENVRNGATGLKRKRNNKRSNPIKRAS